MNKLKKLYLVFDGARIKTTEIYEMYWNVFVGILVLGPGLPWRHRQSVQMTNLQGAHHLLAFQEALMQGSENAKHAKQMSLERTSEWIALKQFKEHKKNMDTNHTKEYKRI